MAVVVRAARRALFERSAAGGPALARRQRPQMAGGAAWPELAAAVLPLRARGSSSSSVGGSGGGSKARSGPSSGCGGGNASSDTASRPQQVFEVLAFAKDGSFVTTRMNKVELLRASGLHPRDLIVLDSGYHRRPRPMLLVRNTSFVVAMSFVRAIVKSDAVYLFHPSQPRVLSFARSLSEFLQGKRAPFYPQVYLGAPGHLLDLQYDDLLGQEVGQLEPEPKVHLAVSAANRELLQQLQEQQDRQQKRLQVQQQEKQQEQARSQLNSPPPHRHQHQQTETKTPLGLSEPRVTAAPTEPPPAPPEESPSFAAAAVSMLASVGAPGGEPGPDGPAPFELRALEGILSNVSRRYHNRTLLLTPLVKNVLTQLSSRPVDPEILHQLLPMKDTLHNFEIETTLLRDVLKELIHNEDDMLGMLLTDKQALGAQQVPRETHAKVELLLETYCSQMVDVAQEAYYLRKRVEGTQSIIELKLDTHRNYMLNVNIQLAMASVAIATATSITGLFGANLTTGLEHSPYAFAALGLVSGSAGAIVFIKARKMVESAETLRGRGGAPRIDSIFMHLDEIQSILTVARSRLSHGSQPMTRLELKATLTKIAGVNISDEDLDILFQTFDLDKDGSITDRELTTAINRYRTSKEHMSRGDKLIKWFRRNTVA